MLKNTAVRHAYIKFVQNYPFFQQREIPIGLILTQSVVKCQSHLIKKICISFTGKPRGKMNDVDGLASDLGFVLKVEQKKAVESHLRVKDVFGVLPTSFGKSLIFQLFVLTKNRASSSPNVLPTL